MTVASIGDRQIIVLRKGRKRSHRYRFLALAKMRRALNKSFHEELLHLLLEETNREHGAKPFEIRAFVGGQAATSPVIVVVGRSNAALNVWRNRAASAPSTARWSQDNRASIRPAGSHPLSVSIGLTRTEDVARCATCGGVTSAGIE